MSAAVIGSAARALLAVLWVAPWASSAPAFAGAGQELEVQAPDGPVLLGERFDLVVLGAPDGATELELGELPAGLRAEATRLEATPDGVRLVQPLRPVREGEMRLDGMAVVTADARHPLPPVDLHIVLDLPAGRIPRVADPLPPVAVPVPPANVLPFAALALLGMGLLGGFVVVSGRRIAPPPPAPRPPDLVATEALAALRLHLPAAEEQVPPFVDRVSAVLRTYAEERFGARAPESTTEEFLAAVAGRHDALAAHAGPLERFLRACDLVKFARHRPPPAGVVPLLDTAEEFVESTRG